jgi:central kinetochore subunit Mal2/MCM21
MTSIDDLDTDIASLRARLTTLHAHRSNLSSVLLSQPHLSTRLSTPTALAAIKSQSTRNLTNIHRACAGVTAYKVLDPDPHALNNGHILGVSIDVGLAGKFVETYHVLLNWRNVSEDGSKVLRIHKHTIPPCVPLQQLANRWLPQAGKDGDEEVQQDLVRFGRGLRKELVAWHLRVRAVEALRREAGVATEKRREVEEANAQMILNAFTSDDEDEEESSDVEDLDAPLRIREIEADAAVRQITVTWSDRRTAVLSVSKDGRIEKAVCRLKNGMRDKAISGKALGPIGGLVTRLKA